MILIKISYNNNSINEKYLCISSLNLDMLYLKAQITQHSNQKLMEIRKKTKYHFLLINVSK